MEVGKSNIRIVRCLLLFSLGVILIINGLMTTIFQKAFPVRVSDEYVINRAKELGYVEAREAIIQNLETEKKAKEAEKNNGNQ